MKEHNLKCKLLWKVIDNIQKFYSNDEKKLNDNEIPFEYANRADELRFADDKYFDNKESCEHSVRGYNNKFNGRLKIKINKENKNSIRYISWNDFFNNLSDPLKELYSEEICKKYKFNHAYEKGCCEAAKCKMFILPNDETADQSESYAEYRIKCDLIGREDFMSEIDFEIYKY